MKAEPIIFDEVAHWDLDRLVFWANRGTERIRCVAEQKAIMELPGFTNARSEEIRDRKAEIRDALQFVAERKITNGLFSKATHDEIEIGLSDVFKG